jgi:hypothetical protein
MLKARELRKLGLCVFDEYFHVCVCVCVFVLSKKRELTDVGEAGIAAKAWKSWES